MKAMKVMKAMKGMKVLKAMKGKKAMKAMQPKKVWTVSYSTTYWGYWHKWILKKLTNKQGKVTEEWHTVGPPRR
jgi:hypothetical protein